MWTIDEFKRALVEDPELIHELLAAVLPAAEALVWRLGKPVEGQKLVRAVESFGSRRDVERWHYNEG